MVDEAGEIAAQHEVAFRVHKAVLGNDIVIDGRHALDLFGREGLIEVVPHPRNGAAWNETRGDDTISHLLIDEPKLRVRMQHRWLFSRLPSNVSRCCTRGCTSSLEKNPLENRQARHEIQGNSDAPVSEVPVMPHPGVTPHPA